MVPFTALVVAAFARAAVAAGGGLLAVPAAAVSGTGPAPTPRGVPGNTPLPAVGMGRRARFYEFLTLCRNRLSSQKAARLDRPPSRHSHEFVGQRDAQPWPAAALQTHRKAGPGQGRAELAPRTTQRPSSHSARSLRAHRGVFQAERRPVISRSVVDERGSRREDPNEGAGLPKPSARAAAEWPGGRPRRCARMLLPQPSSLGQSQAVSRTAGRGTAACSAATGQ